MRYTVDEKGSLLGKIGLAIPLYRHPLAADNDSQWSFALLSWWVDRTNLG
jgi:hypothetical protein